jgi:hypothetical protein
MAWRAGDVVRVFDNLTDPPKYKRLICVDREQGWFFRLNSRPIWKPNMLIPHEGNETWLEHNTYVHLNILEFDDTVVEESLKVPANFLGEISDGVRERLIEAVESASTLTQEQKDAICANLRSVAAK